MLDCVRSMLRTLNDVPRTNHSDEDSHAWGVTEIDALIVCHRHDALDEEERAWLGELWQGFLSVMEAQDAVFERAQALRRAIVARGIRGESEEGLEEEASELVAAVMRPALGDMVAGLPPHLLRAVADIALTPRGARGTATPRTPA